MDEKARAATLGLLEKLERDHRAKARIRYSSDTASDTRKALLDDPDLMKAAIRGCF
jgi:hypothetical protein